VRILIFTEGNEVNEGALRCALALIFLSFGWSIENGGLAHPSFSLWPSVRILIFTEGNEVNEGALRCALALIFLSFGWSIENAIVGASFVLFVAFCENSYFYRR
jgi:hypothetical protein